jgi:glycosyltransferase involved in cell wall biosynthesis
MKKKRVLFSAEASYIPSGFGIYYKELISRLFEKNKYEIAEFATFGHINHPEDSHIKWRYYANSVTDTDPRYQDYISHRSNRHGAWRFDRVLLDFKPDIVINLKDPFMFPHERMTPLRPYFAWIICPTVDSNPQKDEWIDMYLNADAVLTYSQFGYDSLKNISQKIKLVSNAYTGVCSTFKPLPNKEKIRKDMRLPIDSNIIGTVMRNQSRKLFADLFESLAIFLEKTKDNPALQNTFLYCHTGYPDMRPWNFPRLLRDYNVEHKVLFSYLCANCGLLAPSTFKESKTFCPGCRKESALLPSVGRGVSREQLNIIYNIFDIYVQYTVAEGAGFPNIEAAWCGIPVMGTDLTATSDVIEKLNGIPIEVERTFHDIDMDAVRALPNNQKFVNQLINLLSKPKQILAKMGHETKQNAEKYFSWDNNAKIWENTIDNLELKDLQGKWDSPMPLFNRIENIPADLNNDQFIFFAIEYIACRPDLHRTFFEHNLLKNLNYGMLQKGDSTESFTRKNVVEICERFYKSRIDLENARQQKELPPQDYIDYANFKMQLNQ